MMELLTLLRQFGLRRLLFLARYEEWVKDKIYEKGSLRNIDLDRDGNIDGFSFRIKNPLYSAYYKRPDIYIDGEKIDPSTIIIRKMGETISMDEWRDDKPLALIPGETIEIVIRRPGGLKPGKHIIEIKNAGIIGFDTTMDLRFIDKLGE